MTPADLTYVPQFDVVNGVLTVEEHFLLVGQLTCVDKAAMLDRMNLLLDVLGLTQKMHTTVDMLSGGEKKRVSIGLGLISSPFVLFLDGKLPAFDILCCQCTYISHTLLLVYMWYYRAHHRSRLHSRLQYCQIPRPSSQSDKSSCINDHSSALSNGI